MARPTLLITGATGTVGGELARQLTARGEAFVALVRDPAEAADLAALAGAELVRGDLDDVASLDAALAGVERVFLVTPSTAEAEARQLRFVAAAERAGVRHLVKLSQLHAEAESPVRFLRYHAAVERAIRESAMTWTMLRPNLFMQALLQLAPMIASGAPLAAPAGDAAISLIDVRDIAAAAVAALLDEGYDGHTFHLTGPEALTHAEIAARIGEVAGHAVAYVDVPPQEFRAALSRSGMDPWQADGLIEDYAHYRRHEASGLNDGVMWAAGRLPRRFATFLADYGDAFRAAA